MRAEMGPFIIRCSAGQRTHARGRISLLQSAWTRSAHTAEYTAKQPACNSREIVWEEANPSHALRGEGQREEDFSRGRVQANTAGGLLACQRPCRALAGAAEVKYPPGARAYHQPQ
ncbi:hypothetical protein AAFF_G00155000 [Aldrovandia affinis]|uniref:Uncharacterized protein n=1 Tax=Aldrovandia affinis TaxID=143900 RepID=A0AAD7T125_9TELE|nr:hypothetical protein AAFF_G00155000 [Aldrovandia affinis]